MVSITVFLVVIVSIAARGLSRSGLDADVFILSCCARSKALGLQADLTSCSEKGSHEEAGRTLAQGLGLRESQRD